MIQTPKSYRSDWGCWLHTLHQRRFLPLHSPHDTITQTGASVPWWALIDGLGLAPMRVKYERLAPNRTEVRVRFPFVFLPVYKKNKNGNILYNPFNKCPFAKLPLLWTKNWGRGTKRDPFFKRIIWKWPKQKSPSSTLEYTHKLMWDARWVVLGRALCSQTALSLKLSRPPRTKTKKLLFFSWP